MERQLVENNFLAPIRSFVQIFKNKSLVDPNLKKIMQDICWQNRYTFVKNVKLKNTVHNVCWQKCSYFGLVTVN